MMKRSYAVLIASFISLLLGIFLIIYTDGALFIFIYGSFLFLFGFIPALISFMFVVPIDSSDLNESISNKLTTCKVIMAFTFIQFVCSGYTFEVMKNRTAEAKLFCKELIVHLEQQKEQSGKYPPNISYYLNNHNLPIRLKIHRLNYFNHADRYTLTFVETGGFFPRFHEYDSQKREWVMSD